MKIDGLFNHTPQTIAQASHTEYKEKALFSITASFLAATTIIGYWFSGIGQGLAKYVN